MEDENFLKQLFSINEEVAINDNDTNANSNKKKKSINKKQKSNKSKNPAKGEGRKGELNKGVEEITIDDLDEELIEEIIKEEIENEGTTEDNNNPIASINYNDSKRDSSTVPLNQKEIRGQKNIIINASNKENILVLKMSEKMKNLILEFMNYVANKGSINDLNAKNKINGIKSKSDEFSDKIDEVLYDLIDNLNLSQKMELIGFGSKFFEEKRKD
ncbi:MAG: hypothetical protein ACTSRZ_08375 [Promethearchaeota archaeon]